MEKKNEKENNFIITSRIGSHGICQLIKSHDYKLKRKIFTKKYQSKDKPIALHEILINERLSSLNHSSITTFYNYKINQEGDLLLNFEYSEIGSLFDYLMNHISKGSYPNADFLKSVILQITGGLIALHKEGVIHNDLKLENILLFRNNSTNQIIAKIADFNNSLLYDAQNERVIIFMHEPLSSFGNIWEEPSFQFDYWCLGVLIYQLFLHESPFAFDYEIPSLVQNIKTASYKTNNNFKNLSPFILQDLIDKLLIYDPTHRLNDENILNHPFLSSRKKRNVFPIFNRKKNRIDKKIKNHSKLTK